ncbi:uncharacterized protein LOC143225647 [Tachypleus tridentatus]|uniref:uncharacterized protein LOC143225647 n=1 Tax=Tachypleus tridentatus TaxID=6853 RepID=UPI003FCF77F7
MAFNLVQVSLLTLALIVTPSVGKSQNHEEKNTASSRQAKQYVSVGYPNNYIMYGDYKPGVLPFINSYQQPSFTSRLRSFMSNLFFRRSQTYNKPYYQPYPTLTHQPTFLSGQTAVKPVYISPLTGKQVRISPYQIQKYYKPSAPQKGPYVPSLSVQSSGSTYDSKNYAQGGASITSNSSPVKYVSSDYFVHSSTNSKSSPSYGSKTYISGSKNPYGNKNTKLSTTLTSYQKPTRTQASYTNSYQGSSGFQPLSSSSLANHSPVYKPSVYERETKGTGSQTYTG